MSLKAKAYLGYRAVIAHPLKRLRQQGTALDRFCDAYARSEGLWPTSPEDRAIGEAAAACIACGLCETGCDLAGAAPSVRALGLHAAFRLYSRNLSELPLAGDALAACAGCTGCDALCPTGVPISRIVAHLRARVSAGAGDARVRSGDRAGAPDGADAAAGQACYPAPR